MDIRLLKYFITIAEEGSITKAAKRLNMSQPPLSKQMRQLEDEMGVILFIRGKKNIQLTEAGIFLKSRAYELINSFDALERQMMDYQEGKKGRIIIGALEGIATHYLPGILGGFQEKFKDITYEIWCGSTDDILNKLDKGSIDIGFIRTPFDADKYHYAQLLEDTWGVIIPDNHKLAKENIDAVTPSMLKGESLIIPSTAGRVREIQEWFKDGGVEPEILCSYNVLAIGEAMVRERLGLVLVLADYLKVEEKQGLICKQLNPVLTSSVNMLWSKTHYMSDTASRLLEYITSHTQKI